MKKEVKSKVVELTNAISSVLGNDSNNEKTSKIIAKSSKKLVKNLINVKKELQKKSKKRS